MVKIFRALWTHKKKTIFFGGLASWGIHYVVERERLKESMRSLCLEAKKYGDATILNGQQNLRKAVVILNYGSRKSKARKMFEDYAAPLLNLAGMQLTLYSTNDYGKLREYLEHVEPCDALIFAGGDSTIFHCVQAFLTLNKPEFATTPVGIIPLGYSSSVFNAIVPSVLLDEPLRAAKAAMDVVKGFANPAQVLEIKVGEESSVSYAVEGLQLGSLKEVELHAGSLWYLGPLKAVYAYTKAKVKGLLQPINLDVSYSNICVGCKKCVAPRTEAEPEVITPQPVQQRRWWHSLVRPAPLPAKPTSQELSSPIPDFENPDCGVEHQDQISSMDLHVISSNIPGDLRTEKGFLLTHRNLTGDSIWRQMQERTRRIHDISKNVANDLYCKRHVSSLTIAFPTVENETPKMAEVDGHPLECKSPITVQISPQKILLFHKASAS